MEELLREIGGSFAFEEETRYLHRISIRGRGPCENVVFVGCNSEFEPRNPLQMEELLRGTGGSFAFEEETRYLHRIFN